MRGSDEGSIYHHAPFNEAQLLSQNRDIAGARVSFYLSPDPLLRALPHLRPLNSPPPPGRGMSGREQNSRAGGMIITGGEGRAVPLSHCVRSLFHIHCVSVFTRRFCQLDFTCETKDMGMKMIGRATADKNRTRDKTTSETRNGTRERHDMRRHATRRFCQLNLVIR